MSRARRDHLDLAAGTLAVFIVVFYHLFAIGDVAIADDHYFAKALDDRTLGDYLAFRYQRWSGRMAIEALLALVVEHVTLWKAMNAAMLLLFCHASGRLAFSGSGISAPRSSLLALGLFLLMPPNVQFEAAWWRTGSINYLWPAAAGLYGLLAFVDRASHQPLRRMACLLASGFAMHNEQLALALLPVACCLAWRAGARDPGPRGWDIAQIAFMAANAALVFLSPGSRLRYEAEVGLRFPDFASLDLLDKLSIGLELVQNASVGSTQWLTATMALFSLALLWRSPVGRGAKSVLVAALVLVLIPVLGGPWPAAQPALLAYYDPPATGGSSASSTRIYATHAGLGFIVFALVVASSLAFWRERRAMLSCMAVLALGLGSTMAVGFSPTAYASGSRILFVAQVGFLLVTLRMVRETRQWLGPRVLAVMLSMIAILAGYRFIAAV